ncbi:hypothetical protein, partial [Nonomuraea lactucae]|uniref:hypothetical protein n=1 Tax=Nonomuraea lactucae TaxID=2249762 RepID=UPI000DE4D29C
MFAVVCVLLSAGLHTLTGGGAVSLPVLAVATATTWGGAFALGGRRCGRPTILGACLGAQYGLHHLFSSAAGDGTHHVAALGDGLHHLFATPHGLECLLTGGISFGGGAGNGVDGRMLMVHVAVALVSSWWLERGEAALSDLVRLALTSVHELLARLLVPLAPPITVAAPALSSARAAPVPPAPPHT